LLAADALVTYAFEETGSDPVALGDRANAAMARIAALASVVAAPNSTTEASTGARVDARE
ncbi:MAG TPA: hypothetical protein VJU87_08980, partial [Gemmatimonadaceae bacterium]|nr:hypothetical protein [Gemmatimonadaceae bacterium]